MTNLMRLFLLVAPTISYLALLAVLIGGRFILAQLATMDFTLVRPQLAQIAEPSREIIIEKALNMMAENDSAPHAVANNNRLDVVSNI
jgi:hypothetical protein